MPPPKLPGVIQAVYRGGASLVFQPHEVKIDNRTGLLKTTHGISVDADLQRVVQFGGAFLVKDVPEELTIIQRGRRPQHFEIVPAAAMIPERYQELLDQIELDLILEE